MRPAEAIIAELTERQLLELATRVAKEHHLTVAELTCGRGKDIMAMRQHFYFECLELGLAGVRIARMFGVDPSSVTYGAKRWQRARVAAMSGVGPVFAAGGTQ